MKRNGWRLEGGGWRLEHEGRRLGARGWSSNKARSTVGAARCSRCHFSSRQRGMSLVAAIFLIVIVAMLGSFAVRLGMGQHQTVNLALLSSRALAAANAGIEWSAANALNPPNTCTGASTSFTLTQGALAGFAVTVTCTRTVFLGEGKLYVMSSSARYGTYGQPDYVSRTVTARFFQ
jgi:MSHA biogenesis protein MshP